MFEQNEYYKLYSSKYDISILDISYIKIKSK